MQIFDREFELGTGIISNIAYPYINNDYSRYSKLEKYKNCFEFYEHV